MQDEQGALYDQVSKKNKKVSNYNSDLSAAQTRAANLAKLCASKEEKFAEEQKAADRKVFLEDRKTVVAKETSKVCLPTSTTSTVDAVAFDRRR